MIQFDQMPAAPELLNGVVRPPVAPRTKYEMRSALAALQGRHIDGLKKPAYAVPPTPEQHRLAATTIPPAIAEVQRNTLLIKSAQKIQQGR